MAINLDNFIKVSFNVKELSTIETIRDTVVLFQNVDSDTTGTKECASISDYEGNNELIKKYLNIFFKNGGVKVLVQYCATITKNGLTTAIGQLDRNIIGVAVLKSDGSSLTSSDIPSLTGGNQKIFVTHISTEPSEATGKENFVEKYGDAGVEMSVLAYLTRVKVYGYDTVRDYAFTVEDFDGIEGNYFTENNTIVQGSIDKCYNVAAKISGTIRNIGGNDTSGRDLMNQYMSIVLTQTLTDRLFNVLSSKVRYDQNGLSTICATISQELNRYVSNGYLSKDKIWEDDDVVIDGHTLITKGTSLSQGYKYLVMPFSSLTPEEKQAHQLPKIYIIIAESYSIRGIEIDGTIV